MNEKLDSVMLDVLDRTRALEDIVLDIGHYGLVLQVVHVHHHHLLVVAGAGRRRGRHHGAHRYRAHVGLEVGRYRLRRIRWLMVLLVVHVVMQVMLMVGSSILSLVILDMLHVVLLLQMIRRVV